MELKNIRFRRLVTGYAMGIYNPNYHTAFVAMTGLKAVEFSISGISLGWL